MTIDGVQYDRHKVKSVILDLETCKLILKVIFIKGKNDVVKVMDYEYQTNCDVNINHYINELKKLLNE